MQPSGLKVIKWTSFSFLSLINLFPFDCRMNISSAKNEEQEWRSSTKDYEIILWCTVFILTVIAILCANIFAIFIFTTKRLLRKRNNILLMNLATADLIIGGIAFPMFVGIFYMSSTHYQWRDMILNQMYICVDIFAALSSMMILAVIALERAFSVFFPLKHRCTSRRSRFYWFSAAFAWIMAAALTTLKALKWKSSNSTVIWQSRDLCIRFPCSRHHHSRVYVYLDKDQIS